MPLLLSALLWACGDDGPRPIDITGIDLELGVERMDRAVFHDAGEATTLPLRLQAAHGSFFHIYVSHILGLPPVGDPGLAPALASFASDPDWRDAQAAVDEALGDLRAEEHQLEQAFKRLVVLFPDSIVPRVIAFNSGYNYGVFPTDSVLGIGLEWFIGSDHPVVGYLSPEIFPNYMKERMVPEMLVPGAMKGWLMVHYLSDVRGRDLLGHLVETGKVMVLLDALLPDTEPTLKFAFTGAQLHWCESSEARIWNEIVGKELLFSRKAEDIGRIMNDGPFTNGFPRESPGHIGEWVGYRMVKAYMQAHPKVTFQQLFAIEDPNIILKSYKPR